MKSIMSHDFATTPRIDAPRSKFDRSYGHKTNLNSGWLVPIYWDSVLPGDTFNLRMTAFGRMATALFPIMDNAFIDSHFFFVPNRLLWDNWRKFCGEQVDPGDSIDYTIPILSNGGAAGTYDSNADATLNPETGTNAQKALLNYMGVPHGIGPEDVDISALPFRAYSRIYNEWFRDQNLIDSVDAGLLTDDGPDDQNSAGDRHSLQRRGKRHDYFTSALPWPQKGDAVSLPLGTTAPIYGIDQDTKIFNEADATKWNLNFVTSGNNINASGTPSADQNLRFSTSSSEVGLVADLTTATAATINDLREAFQVQKLLERDARGGTRYSEIINNHFGVKFYDVSYRPEYLGGGSSPLNVTPVAYTATLGGSVGDLGAMGTISVNNHGFTKTFVEHGIVLGLVSIRADLTYQQGLNRHFSHSTRYDIYWPSLAHLGEQAILNKEIYCDGTANDDLVFGYIPRYDEYRYKQSQISGVMQSAATASLDVWHLSQEFTSLPSLGKTFIEEDPPFDRVLLLTSEPEFILDTYIDLKCARPIPVNGVPGMIDHF